MSMAKCKCDKIIDTDEEIGFDEKGECCCDNCECDMYEKFVEDLEKAGCPTVEIDNVADILMNLGYRKVK